MESFFMFSGEQLAQYIKDEGDNDRGIPTS